VIIGFVGLVANIWFKHQHLKIARKEAEKWVGYLYWL
jgi:hypothetical protein